MRELVRTGQFVTTLHAGKAKEPDELNVFDIARCTCARHIVERLILVAEFVATA